MSGNASDCKGSSVLQGRLGSVPGSGLADPLGCFLRPKFIDYDCESILVTNRKSNPATIGNMVLREYSNSVPGIFFVDPFDLFCSAETCRSFVGGRAVYSDSSHLSKDGSSFFVNGFYRQLFEEMQ